MSAIDAGTFTRLAAAETPEPDAGAAGEPRGAGDHEGFAEVLSRSQADDAKAPRAGVKGGKAERGGGEAVERGKARARREGGRAPSEQAAPPIVPLVLAPVAAVPPTPIPAPEAGVPEKGPLTAAEGRGTPRSIEGGPVAADAAAIGRLDLAEEALEPPAPPPDAAVGSPLHDPDAKAPAPSPEASADFASSWRASPDEPRGQVLPDGVPAQPSASPLGSTASGARGSGEPLGAAAVPDAPRGEAPSGVDRSGPEPRPPADRPGRAAPRGAVRGQGGSPGAGRGEATAAASTTSARAPDAASLTRSDPRAAEAPPPRAPVPPAHARAMDEGAERLHASVTAAMSHISLRHKAHATLDHPEIGRVGIEARAHAGRVEVEIRPERAHGVEVLRSASAEMAADVRAAAIPLARLSVEVASGGAGGPGGSLSNGGGGHGRREAAEHGSGPGRAEAEPARPVGRVRAVL